MVDLIFPFAVVFTGYFIPSLVTLSILHSTGLKQEKDTLVARFIGSAFLVLIFPSLFFALICLFGISDFGFQTRLAAYLSLILAFGIPVLLLLLGLRLLFLKGSNKPRKPSL